MSSTDVATVPAIKGEVTNLTERSQRVGQGSENVRTTDRMIPRLKLLQAISQK